MNTLGQEILEKYHLRKETIKNMGNELEEITGIKNNFSSELEKNIYDYNINLEKANENILEKGRIIISNSGIKRFIKKVVRKLLFIFCGNLLGALNYFQEKAVNIFIANRDVFIYQNDRIEKIQKKIEESEAELTDKIEKIKESYTKLADKIEKIKESNDELADKIGHSYVQDGQDNQYTDFKDDCEIVLEKFRDGEEDDEHKLSAAFYNRMEMLVNEKENIIIFCAGLQEYGNIEAIRNEAYDTFAMLSKNKKYNVTLVSLEHRDAETAENIIYVTRGRVADVLKKMNPSAILILESLPLVALDFNGVFYRYRTIIKITSQNPLQGLKIKQIDELRHANDLGVFHFIVESVYAKQVMADNGFFNVEVMYPILDFHRICIDKTIGIKEKYMIGYASAPILDVQMGDKGVFLLEKMVKMLPDVQFKILWRNKNLQIPKSLCEVHNCSVVYGQTDMKEFYHEIDILLIPYMSENNHACPLSAVEAVLSHVPVICTEQSGAAEIVRKYHAGIMCKADVTDFCKSISKMTADYDIYFHQLQVSQAREDFSASRLKGYISKVLSAYFPKEFITIQHWYDILSESGRYLVRGHDNIKSYYSNQDIASDYNNERFIQYPGNCYDIMERSSINVIMGQMFKNRKDDIWVLDIASGDGRIVQENLRWGKCTAVDSSVPMLAILKKRFQNERNLEIQKCDFFTDDIHQKFDAVTAFRYIRHYDGLQRRKIYNKVKECLKEDGVLIFDVCNIQYSMEDRRKAGWSGFNIYDVFWTEDTIKEELNECGFKAVYLLPIEIKDIKQGPVTWTVAAQPYREGMK